MTKAIFLRTQSEKMPAFYKRLKMFMGFNHRDGVITPRN